ncbi:hypothetical protein [Burkholderia sp. ABCPW 111]|uniref:hypothetical protein n=1 Tax=Burkholderia sp. ABCPW 111 TaxID=1820025 RepID=UPI000572150B|nr:hypothetical protein [Burkholderia sp. ABCPW 111]
MHAGSAGSRTIARRNARNARSSPHDRIRAGAPSAFRRANRKAGLYRRVRGLMHGFIRRARSLIRFGYPIKRSTTGDTPSAHASKASPIRSAVTRARAHRSTTPERTTEGEPSSLAAIS